MSGIDWMAFNVDDYVSNTMHLTARQHGGYILLICAAWKAKGYLPGSDAALMAITRMTPKDWREDGPVLKAFLTRRGDAWVHERVEFEWKDAQTLIEAKRKAGKEGARKRWHGRGNGTAMADPSQTHRQTAAPIPEPIPEPSSSKNVCVSDSAPVSATHTQTPCGRGDWEPSDAAIATLRMTLPWMTGPLFDHRMQDFRDWCAEKGITSLDWEATWSKFMRRTTQPVETLRGTGKAAKAELPADEPWEARMSGWRKSKFWMPTNWGPRPGEAGCRVPARFLDTTTPRFSAIEAA